MHRNPSEGARFGQVLSTFFQVVAGCQPRMGEKRVKKPDFIGFSLDPMRALAYNSRP